MKTTEIIREKRERLSAVKREANELVESTQGEFTPEQKEKFDSLERQAKDLDDSLNTLIRNVEIQGNNVPEVELSKKERKQYSILRAIRSLAEHRPIDGIEGEVSDEIAKLRGESPKGFYIPTSMYQRDLTSDGTGVSNTSAAGLIHDDQQKDIVSLLREKLIVNQLGARQVTGLVGNFPIARVTAGSNGYWYEEANAPAESSMATSSVNATPKHVGAFTDITRKVMVQSNPDAEMMVREDLASTLAITIDKAAFHGLGESGQPEGLLVNSSVSVVEETSDLYSDLISLESAVEEAKALQGKLAYVTTPKGKAVAKATEISESTPGFAWSMTNTMNGYDAYSTAMISNKQISGAYECPLLFGNFDDLILCYWSGIDITVDPYTNSKSGGIRVVALADVDVVIRHPESFAKTNITVANV